MRYAAHFSAVGAAVTLRLGPTLAKNNFPALVQALCSPFYCCWCRYYTTVRADAAQMFVVGVVVMLPILLLLVPLLHYGEGQCCPNFRRWSRRYAARFTAVGVGVTLPILLLLVPFLHYG